MTGVKRMRKEDEWGEFNRRDQIDMGVGCTLKARTMYLPPLTHTYSNSIAVFESCCTQLASSSHLHFLSVSSSALMFLTEFIVKITIIN
jgi:hypothetical protein